MNKINVVTDFAMEQNFRISNNQANIIKINNFIKNICDDSVFFREAVYKVTSEFKIYGELENDLKSFMIVDLIHSFFKTFGFWLPYRPMKGDLIYFDVIVNFVENEDFKKFLLFLLENHFLLDNSSRFIIQDVPMKISDIYIKENGFLVFFTHWNS
jgi:hypothetical protein